MMMRALLQTKGCRRFPTPIKVRLFSEAQDAMALVPAFHIHNFESSVLFSYPQAKLCPPSASEYCLVLKLAGIANMIIEAESSLYYTTLLTQQLRCDHKDHDVNFGLESAAQDQYK